MPGIVSTSEGEIIPAPINNLGKGGAGRKEVNNQITGILSNRKKNEVGKCHG